MRIVRFYLEPWQKGGTPSPSPSLQLLSPRIKRRQRLPNMDGDTEVSSTLDKPSDKEDKEKKLSEKKKSYRLRYRYPQTVKRLSQICSDVLAKSVWTC